MPTIILDGVVSRDVERQEIRGIKLFTFDVAARGVKSKEHITFWRISCWGEKFEKFMGMVEKGSAIVLTGDLEIRPFKDKQDMDRLSNDVQCSSIHFAPQNMKLGVKQKEAPQGPQGPTPAQKASLYKEDDIFGEVPF